MRNTGRVTDRLGCDVEHGVREYFQTTDAEMPKQRDRFDSSRRARRLEINTGDSHKHENNGYMAQLIHDTSEQ